VNTPTLDLDFTLPEIPGRGFPPPVLSMEQYVRFVEETREMLRENNMLADIIARRPRPSEEMFVLK